EAERGMVVVPLLKGNNEQPPWQV
ncbi:uncharacterized protein METZ01_LOCUS245565, partial [marine metagenome]